MSDDTERDDRLPNSEEGSINRTTGHNPLIPRQGGAHHLSTDAYAAVLRLRGELEEMQHLSDDQIFTKLGLQRNGRHKDLWDNISNAMLGVGPLCLYRPVYSLMLVWHMMQGKTFMSFCACVGVSYSTTQRWTKAFADFRTAREIGESFLRSHWEHISLLSSEGLSRGNAAVIIFMLKNLWPDDFKDKREIENSGHSYVIDTGIKRDPVTVSGESRPVDGIKQVEAPVKKLHDGENIEDKEDRQARAGQAKYFDPMEALGLKSEIPRRKPRDGSDVDESVGIVEDSDDLEDLL